MSRNALAEDAFEKIGRIQRDTKVGETGNWEWTAERSIWCFNQNDKNRFKIFGERYSDVDQTKYVQLLKLF